MTPFPRLHCLLLLLMALAIPPLRAQTPVRLNDTLVLQFLDRLQQASSRREVREITSFYDPEALFQIVYKHSYGENAVEQSMTIPFSKYQEDLARGWKNVTQYSFKIKNIKIKTTPNGAESAVSYTTVETMTSDGQPLMIETKRLSKIILKNGKPLITVTVLSPVIVPVTAAPKPGTAKSPTLPVKKSIPTNAPPKSSEAWKTSPAQPQ
ncbi:MAG: hypothetical protein SFY92_03455 [Verrucomicrobiae bacterium]|nr:hypothetical protein [Verrucomicrobiae bacterium]